VLVQTVLSAFDFFMHYLVVFAVAFLTFCLSGYILFGEQNEGWSTVGRSINSLFMVMFGEFPEHFKGDAAITAGFWFWTCYITFQVLLFNILLAAIVHRYLDVRARLGEPGAGLFRQCWQLFNEFWWMRSYEGTQKSVPPETLLDMLSADTDPAHIEKCGRLNVDRRLRTREDLAKAELDPPIDVQFLVDRGCNERAAEQLLDKVRNWRFDISMTSAPSHRLMIMLAKHMTFVKAQTEYLQSRMHARVDAAAKSVDRLDLKHAKCVPLARRIRKAQELPHGWTSHADEDGRRYLRHEESGLTSWTLPRQLI
jgi:hypothetical protein